MSFTWRQLLDQGTYWAWRYTYIKQVEERGSYHLTTYFDTKGIPTIGLGFNLQVHAATIMAAMGIDRINSAETKYVTAIESAIAAGGSTLQADLDAIMAQRAADAAVPGGGGPKRATFSFNNEDEIKAVFVEIARLTYEPEILKWETQNGLVPPGATDSS